MDLWSDVWMDLWMGWWMYEWTNGCECSFVNWNHPSKVCFWRQFDVVIRFILVELLTKRLSLKIWWQLGTHLQKVIFNEDFSTLVACEWQRLQGQLRVKATEMAKGWKLQMIGTNPIAPRESRTCQTSSTPSSDKDIFVAKAQGIQVSTVGLTNPPEARERRFSPFTLSVKQSFEGVSKIIRIVFPQHCLSAG